MLTCKKCGFELHEDQKVCIQCGTRTIRGDGFDYEHKKWRPTKPMKIGAGIVCFILLVVMIANALRITPPGEIAQEWFDAMAKGKVKTASRMVTESFITGIESRGMDLGSVAAEYAASKYKLGKAVMSGESAAAVPVTITDYDGTFKVLNVKLIKDGRHWLVNAVE